MKPKFTPEEVYGKIIDEPFLINNQEMTIFES